MALVIMNPPAKTGDTRDVGSTPGSGRSPGVGNGNPTPVFLPEKIPWAEEPGGLQSVRPQTVRHN